MGTAKFIFKSIDVFTKRVMNPRHIKNITTVINDQYDLYYANTNPSGCPIIINIHGGGFLAGDKKYRRYWCEILAEQGWFVINVNYRLCPTVTIIEQIKDIVTVVNKIPNFAAKYDLEETTITVTGDSAGAYFAAYLVALSTNPILSQKLNITLHPTIKFSGALLFCGVYDFGNLLEQKNSQIIREVASCIAGVKFKNLNDIKNYKFYHELSIPQYINQHWCPVELYYAKKDLFVKGQGELMYQALCEHQVTVTQHYTEKLRDNHGYQFFFNTKTSQLTIESALIFLKKIKNKFDISD